MSFLSLFVTFMYATPPQNAIKVWLTFINPVSVIKANCEARMAAIYTAKKLFQSVRILGHAATAPQVRLPQADWVFNTDMTIVTGFLFKNLMHVDERKILPVRSCRQAGYTSFYIYAIRNQHLCGHIVILHSKWFQWYLMIWRDPYEQCQIL